MSKADLEAILEPATLMTRGQDYHEVLYEVHNYRQCVGALELPKVLREIFSIRSLRNVDTIKCWYDCLRDWGDKSHYLHLQGVLMMGVFYKEERKEDVITHFFIRNLADYWGPLEKWKTDLKFPSGTRKYSVCAVLPKGFVMPVRGERDPYNHSVTQFTWEQIEDMGINLPALLGYVMYGD